MLERTLYKYREIGLLVLRLVVSIIFFSHGHSQLFGEAGISQTAQSYTEWGVFYPTLVAWIIVLGEWGGGICLFFGLLTREVALFFTVVMIGAIWFVHYANGFFITQNGYEYNLALIGACVCLVLSGGGTGAIDKILFPRARWTFISDPSRIKLEPPDHILE